MKDGDDRTGGNKGRLDPMTQPSGFHAVQPYFVQNGYIEEANVFISFLLVPHSHHLKDSGIPTASPILVKCHGSYHYSARKRNGGGGGGENK